MVMRRRSEDAATAPMAPYTPNPRVTRRIPRISFAPASPVPNAPIWMNRCSPRRTPLFDAVMRPKRGATATRMTRRGSLILRKVPIRGLARVKRRKTAAVRPRTRIPKPRRKPESSVPVSLEV